MEVTRTRCLTQNRPWLNLFESTWRKDKKTKGKWAFASRRKKPQLNDFSVPDAVTIVPVVQGQGEPRLILTHGYRVPIRDGEWSFPAGLLEKGETTEECARRELPEETGYVVEEVTAVSPVCFSSAGMTDESNVMVFCRCSLPEGAKQCLDEAEEIAVHSLNFSEMVELMDRPGQKFSAKTWLVLHMYRTLGRFQ